METQVVRLCSKLSEGMASRWLFISDYVCERDCYKCFCGRDGRFEYSNCKLASILHAKLGIYTQLSQTSHCHQLVLIIVSCTLTLAFDVAYLLTLNENPAQFQYSRSNGYW